MIINFLNINKYLHFSDENDFYFISIIKRRKDNPELPKSEKIIDHFYVYSNDDFQKLESKILNICNINNARAYIWLNKRNAKKIALQMLKRTADLIANEDYKAISRIYPSICGEFHSEINKKWIIDLDGVNLDTVNSEELKEKYKEPIFKYNRENKMNFIVYGFIPTKNGTHMITSPFPLDKIKFEGIDIHKDQPTLLYCP